jgi:7-keto-8-aminopelargonate synthetase-like enzyme
MTDDGETQLTTGLQSVSDSANHGPIIDALAFAPLPFRRFRQVSLDHLPQQRRNTGEIRIFRFCARVLGHGVTCCS